MEDKPKKTRKGKNKTEIPPDESAQTEHAADRDEVIATLLAIGKTTNEIAIHLNLSRLTLYSLISGSTIRQRAREIRAEMIASVSGRYVEAYTKVIDRLLLLMDSARSEIAQLHAARAIMDYGIKLTEVVDHQQQIDKLKQMIDELTHTK